MDKKISKNLRLRRSLVVNLADKKIFSQLPNIVEKPRHKKHEFSQVLYVNTPLGNIQS